MDGNIVCPPTLDDGYFHKTVGTHFKRRRHQRVWYRKTIFW